MVLRSRQSRGSFTKEVPETKRIRTRAADGIRTRYLDVGSVAPGQMGFYGRTAQEIKSAYGILALYH